MTNRYGQGPAGCSLLLVALLGTVVGIGTGQAQTGRLVPEMVSYDRIMPALLAEWNVPGASVAVVKDERLVFARGYGLADTSSRSPVQPRHRFRIASISKPVTAVAVLTLVEAGELRLEDRPFDLLDLAPLPGTARDPRLAQVSIRHLLQHAGGWDRAVSGDPMFRPRTVARAAGVASPPELEITMGYMLGRPLDFDPGARFAYSNFGYAVLGEVIERVTGMRYDDYVRGLLARAGVTSMALGKTRYADRHDDEVTYYGYLGEA